MTPPDLQRVLGVFLSEHKMLAPLVFVLLRAVVVIIPPLPGFVVDLAGIAVFGAVRAFVFAEIGIMVGASVSFAIARQYRERVLSRFSATHLKEVQRWYADLSTKRQFWSWVGIRLPTNVAFDYINYAAGLTQCSWPVFVASTFIGSLPGVAIFFYFGRQALMSGIVSGALLIGTLAILATIIARRRLPPLDSSD
jgi:uncharacterized membrane protein YdjX (TVP38/TMEM64 family)